MTLNSSVKLSSKQPDVGTTIFSVIGQLSAQHQAINLSQGAPISRVTRSWLSWSARRCATAIISTPR